MEYGSTKYLIHKRSYFIVKKNREKKNNRQHFDNVHKYEHRQEIDEKSLSDTPNWHTNCHFKHY